MSSSRSSRSVGWALLAALLLAVTLGTWFKVHEEGSSATGSDGSAIPILSPSTAPWVATGGTPKVDYVIDLDTGAATPLPDAIIRSLGSLGAGGSRAECLGQGPEPCLPQYAVSPDGSVLAYVGTGDTGSPQIFIANVDGTELHQVTHHPGGAMSPAWSPMGTRIAYVGNGTHLFVLDVATGASKQITDEPRDLDGGIQFTPDGSSILYTGGTYEHPLLMTLPVTGGRSTLLVGPGEGLTDAGNGSMSPDGSLVTFLGSGVPASGEVEHCGPCRFMANADGTERRVIPGWMSIPAGTWSPDGSRIVVSDGTTAPTIIVVVDVATRAGTTVANGRAAIWVDDHSLLVEV